MIKIVTHKRKGCFYCGKTVYAGTGNYVKPFKLFDNKKLVHIKCNILKKAFKKKDSIKKIKYKKNKYKKNFVETKLWNELKNVLVKNYEFWFFTIYDNVFYDSF